jgi:sterol desaturase/sphingolipid hydroxylase (fatty acid hydroxylase superfamily)
MQKQRDSIRLFKSDFLERFSHVHPITPLVVWVPVISYLLWRSVVVRELPVSGVLAIGAFGVFVWTLAEWWLHRSVFHFKSDTAWGKRFQFIIHGLHHDDPQDPTRLVMPPVPAVAIATVLFAVFRLAMGPVWVEPFFAFFLLGYLWYDYTHYAVHHFTPRTSFGKKVKQHHMLHHFVHQEARWGVSSPLWDYIFGTLENKARPERKKGETLA